MSFKEVFMIWGQGTQQRTQDALKRAEAEMRQKAMSDVQRRQELMELLKLEYTKMGQLRKLQSSGLSASDKIRALGVVVQSNEAIGKVDKDIKESYDKSLIDAEDEFAYDSGETQALNNSVAHADTISFVPSDSVDFTIMKSKGYQPYLAKLKSSIKEKGKGSAGVLLHEIGTTFADRYEVSTGKRKDPKEFIDLFQKEIGITAKPIGQTVKKEAIKSKAKENLKNYKTDWRSKDIERLDSLSATRERANQFVETIASDSDKKLVSNLMYGSKKKIKKLEKELYKKPEVIAPDSLAIQKRAGQILLSEEIGKDVAKMPADEIDYYRSLPDAEKFVDKEKLPNDTVGKYVSKFFLGKERRPWSEMNASVTNDFNGTDINKARSMIASRMIRAYRQEQQPAEEAKIKAIDKQAKNIVAQTKSTTVKAPPPIAMSYGQPANNIIKSGTVLKQNEEYGYGYKVSYDKDGNPVFTYVRRGEERKGPLNEDQQAEALSIYNRRLDR